MGRMVVHNDKKKSYKSGRLPVDHGRLLGGGAEVGAELAVVVAAGGHEGLVVRRRLLELTAASALQARVTARVRHCGIKDIIFTFVFTI